MSRTLEMIEDDLRKAKEELKQIQEAFDKANKKVGDFLNELKRYKIDNGIYHPMSDLSQYIGCNIRSIKLVERDTDGSLNIDEIYGYEIFEVDKNGHLYYSSEFGGTMNYDECIGKYIMLRSYYTSEHDYVGFLEIKIKEN